MPSWTPMCKSMQVYCEPFFVAVNRWRSCGNEDIMRNRIALCETAFEIFNEYLQARQNVEFDLVCENSDVALEDEVLPTAGKEYQFGGDRVAYDAARKLVPEAIFNRVGIFYQQNLLKSMAGFSEGTLATCNDFNRKSILAAVEKLFRIATNAGKAHFVKRVSDGNSPSKFKNHPTVPISANGQTFGDLLRDSVKRVHDNTADNKHNNSSSGNTNGNSNTKKRKQPSASSSSSSSATKAKKSKPNHNSSSADAAEESTDFTTNHGSVGTLVANYFTLPGGRKLFQGQVVAYAPPSRPRAKDQLYHVRWEDGDEEDYDEDQLRTATALYTKHYATKNSNTNTTTPNKASSSSAAKRQKQAEVVLDLSADEDEDADEDTGNNATNEEAAEEAAISEEWTTNHPSVGTKVAAVFTYRRKSSLYQGTVTRYCPPTCELNNNNNNGGHSSSGTEAEEEQDQLYHILWEDCDEEDYDEAEFQRGVALYRQKFGNKNSSTATAAAAAKASRHQTSASTPNKHTDNDHSDNRNSNKNDNDEDDAKKKNFTKTTATGQVLMNYDASCWTTNHASVNSFVAIHLSSGKTITGQVTKYCTPSSSSSSSHQHNNSNNNHQDQLYHVVLEDGDACDLDEVAYQQGIALYQQQQQHGDQNHVDENIDTTTATMDVDTTNTHDDNNNVGQEEDGNNHHHEYAHNQDGGHNESNNNESNNTESSHHHNVATSNDTNVVDDAAYVLLDVYAQSQTTADNTQA